MLEQLATRLGKGLFTVCTAAGQALADAIDKGIDKVCDYIEKEKGGESLSYTTKARSACYYGLSGG